MVYNIRILYVISHASPRVKRFQSCLKQKFQVKILDTAPIWYTHYVDPRIMALVSVPRLLVKIMKEAKHTRASIILVNHPALTTALPSLIVAKLLRIPCVIDYSDLIAIYDTNDYLRSALEVTLCKHATKLIVLTRCWAKVLNKCWKIPLAKIEIIPNSVDTEIVEKLKKIKIEQKSSSPTIVYLGNMVYRKLKQGMVDIQDVNTLFRAIPIITKHFPDAKFIFAGFRPNPRVKEFFKKIGLSHNVIFMGTYKYGSEKHMQLLATADILWFSAIKCIAMDFFDRFKLYEYMAAGKPIVAPDTLSTKEVLGIDYPLARCGDPKQFAEIVIKLLYNPTLYLALSQKVKKSAEKYDWKNISMSLIKIISNCINNKVN